MVAHRLIRTRTGGEPSNPPAPGKGRGKGREVAAGARIEPVRSTGVDGAVRLIVPSTGTAVGLQDLPEGQLEPFPDSEGKQGVDLTIFNRPRGRVGRDRDAKANMNTPTHTR